MLVSGMFLGAKGIQKDYVKVLSLSLLIAGGAMAIFGLKENIFLICGAGFLFFLMLPFANSCLDYLVRTNIADKLQGRVWGMIGFLSQIGYVIAYGLAGVLADGIGEKFQISVGRGAASVIMTSGLLLGIMTLTLYPIEAIRKLENREEVYKSVGEESDETKNNME